MLESSAASGDGLGTRAANCCGRTDGRCGRGGGGGCGVGDLSAAAAAAFSPSTELTLPTLPVELPLSPPTEADEPASEMGVSS